MTKTYVAGPSWDQRIVSLDPKGDIALLMSGGIDSYVLYHLLKPYNPEVVVIDREDGFDNPAKVEVLIRNKVVRFAETSLNPDTRIRDGIKHLENIYDQVYIGINHVPPAEHFPELQQDAPYRPWKIRSPSKVVAPFLYLYKYHIIDLANRCGIDLSNTLSCISNTEYNCGQCWQCREKQWGYDQLNV